MESMRTFIMGALLLVGFMLMNAWITDHAPAPTEKAQVSTTSIAHVANVGLPNPTSGTPIAENHSTVAPVADVHRYIHVRTDLLDVTIDRLGGNVVSAKLLSYPVSLEDKSAPVEILSQDPKNLWIQKNMGGLVRGPNRLL